ncbi:hypothetical protein PAECIP111893_01487 [Paenibacillus plantiphilus]|uniref:Uncharacterized protein n=1 Tax=Paenibacillus plantiphilus TaxID=2905650 RepID=A0ABN8GBP1_9BACL|nr:hypothetical protein PAECIP111893_01487 [Paenibacillus plantiphilus]
MVSDFCNQNSSVFAEPVVREFFNDEHRIMLLALTLEDNQGCNFELEEAFRNYFFRIRFIKYIVSIIKVYSIDQMRRYQKYNERNVLVFDRPVSQDSEASTLGELYLQSMKKDPIVFTPQILIHSKPR